MRVIETAILISLLCLIYRGAIPNEIPAEDIPQVIIETKAITPDAAVLARTLIHETRNYEQYGEDDTIQISQEDAQRLMKIAASEAGNQGIGGMALIMSVVYNRTLSDRWPDTIEEVISQPHQFQSYTNGRYQRAEITPEAHEALALFERNVLKNDYIAFEATYRSKTLSRYFEYEYTYLGHDFFREK